MEGIQLLRVYAGEFSASAHHEESALNSLTRGQLGRWTLLLMPPSPVKALQEAKSRNLHVIVLNIMVSLSCGFPKSLVFAVSLS